jgi:hypothetical protein
MRVSRRYLKQVSTTLFLAVLFTCGCAHITVDGVWEREPSNNAELCLMIPGGGQFCNEQPAKGVAFLLGIAMSSLAYSQYQGTAGGDTALLAGLGLIGWSALDAYKVSNDFNLKGGRKAGVGLGVTPLPDGGKAALTLKF